MVSPRHQVVVTCRDTMDKFKEQLETLRKKANDLDGRMKKLRESIKIKRDEAARKKNVEANKKNEGAGEKNEDEAHNEDTDKNKNDEDADKKTGDNAPVNAEAHALDEDAKKLQSLQQEAEENLFGMGPTDFLSIVNANGWLTDNVIDKYSALINKVC